jgi:hypothetical protein
MLAQLKPVELWTLELEGADLFHIEHVKSDDPQGGGGDLYIQIPAEMVAATLKFLRAGMPAKRRHIKLAVKDPTHPQNPPQTIEFWNKSPDRAGNARLRIARQNRLRPTSTRPTGWSPAAGFPTLASGQRTPAANAVLAGLGGVRLFLARDAQGDVWAGFTQGTPSPAESTLPYAHIAWAPSSGGYWP